MKKLWCCISSCLLLVSSNFLFAQSGNLVRNGSFEEVKGRPLTSAYVHQVSLFWFSPSWGSPDLLSSICNEDGIYWMDTCVNMFGCQKAQIGVSYAGIITYQMGSDFREYLAARIADSLEKDSMYDISFWVSLADSSLYANNRIGICFSTDSIYQASGNALPLIPVVSSDTNSLITDTVEWRNICGKYKANGDEHFILLGNFYDNAHTLVAAVNDTSSSLLKFTYLYIDNIDVRLSTSIDSSIICIDSIIKINDEPINEPGLYYDTICSKGFPHYVFFRKDSSYQSIVQPITIPVIINGNTYTTDTTLQLYMSTYDAKCDSTHVIDIHFTGSLDSTLTVQSFITNGTWQIQNLQTDDEVELYNALGQKVFYQKANSSQLSTNSLHLSDAVYFFSIKRNGAVVLKGKVLIQ